MSTTSRLSPVLRKCSTFSSNSRSTASSTSDSSMLSSSTSSGSSSSRTIGSWSLSDSDTAPRLASLVPRTSFRFLAGTGSGSLFV
ncbi:hypothetical protein OGATHE_006085 [Ogataea polymorpha]|uniref:Uncharacterized protein n=1 Tax=Ogataea polymorpha TaxID=460523 RepID=A0A9P8NU22_9ASCO|nr:hypothetical protein OGATHE_006085 [Ogataea polymorpha]